MREDKQLIALSIKKEVVQQLKEEARQLDLTLSAYIRLIIAKRNK